MSVVGNAMSIEEILAACQRAKEDEAAEGWRIVAANLAQHLAETRADVEVLRGEIRWLEDRIRDLEIGS